MGYRDPKTEGTSAHAVSAMLTLTSKWHGLNDVQTLSIFSELAKRAPQSEKAPTRKQWDAWLERAHRKVTQSVRSLSEARRKSLHERLDKAIDPPTARVWFALRHIDGECKVRAAALNGYLAQIAQIAGRPRKDVLAEFETRLGTVGTARANGDGRSTRSVFHGHVPSDYATITVLGDMRREAVDGANLSAIDHIPVGGALVQSYGYDPDTGRLEVTLAGATYAYRVPEHVASRLAEMDPDSDEPGEYIAQKVFPNPAFAWEPGQAAMRVCPACSEPVAQVHPCSGPQSAPYATPVVVDLDPGAERIASDGTVAVLLRAPGVRNDLIVNGSVTVPVVIITAPDKAAEVLGAKYTITGELTLTTDDIDSTALKCSCPAPVCQHVHVAAQQVHHLVLWGTLPDAAEVSD